MKRAAAPWDGIPNPNSSALFWKIPPGGSFLQRLLLSNPQQFSTLNAQKNVCVNKEGRKRGRGRTTNVIFGECKNPHSIPQSTFSIPDKYMEFYLMTRNPVRKIAHPCPLTCALPTHAGLWSFKVLKPLVFYNIDIPSF